MRSCPKKTTRRKQEESKMPHQSINQSINRTINQSINQSIKRTIKQSNERSINQSINQSIERAIKHWLNQAISWSIEALGSFSVRKKGKKVANLFVVIHGAWHHKFHHFVNTTSPHDLSLVLTQSACDAGVHGANPITQPFFGKVLPPRLSRGVVHGIAPGNVDNLVARKREHVGQLLAPARFIPEALTKQDMNNTLKQSLKETIVLLADRLWTIRTHNFSLH